MFVLRQDVLLYNITEGRMKGKPRRRRRRLQMLHDLANGDGYAALNLAVENRKRRRYIGMIPETWSTA